MIGRYSWDERLARYRDPRGRLMSTRQVRDAIDAGLAAARAEMRSLSQRLQRGQISIADWQTAMRQHIKDIHIGSATIAKGGYAQMSQADWGRVGQRLREQYAYLNKFADQLARGEAPLDGRFLVRVDLYAESGRSTFHAVEHATWRGRGYNEACRVLGAAEHCGGCVEAADRGWVPIDDVLPIGAAECMSRCKCFIEYRRNPALEAPVAR